VNTLWNYKYWIAGAFGLLVLGLIIGAVRPKHVSGAPASAPANVQVVLVEQRDVPVYGEWIGTLDGLVNADVRAQVTGYLLHQDYQEGAFVRKGQLLFQIDQRSLYSAELTLAEARGDEYQSLVRLYRALGGGWQQQ